MNYAWPYYERHKQNLPADVRARLESGDIHVHTHEFGNALLKKDFAEDSLQYEIDLDKEIDISCPVRIITSLNDTETNPDDVVKLTRALKSDDVDLIYRFVYTVHFDLIELCIL